MVLHRISRAVMVAGVLLLVAVGASHLVTARTAHAAQLDKADEWVRLNTAKAQTVGEGAGGLPGRQPVPIDGAATPLANDAAIARVEIRRPGEGLLMDGPFFVGEGIEPAQIDQGPSHYPTSALPGEDGNFAVAGHRTMHGAPFGHLDQLRRDDEIRVTDRAGRRFDYRVVEQRIVHPSATWVVDPDPLGTGTPTLTFTTCHPRYSARQRLVVWAELETETDHPDAARGASRG
ncbi:hypothetical protein BH23ACT10_BH23ACT10_19830 [soil metagenome]